MKAARAGDVAGATQAHQVAHQAFLRAKAAAEKAHEFAAKATSDPARKASGAAARRAKSNAVKAAKAAHAARSAVTAARQRGVLGSEETRRVRCDRGCDNGQVILVNERDEIVGTTECLACGGSGWLSAAA